MSGQFGSGSNSSIEHVTLTLFNLASKTGNLRAVQLLLGHTKLVVADIRRISAQPRRRTNDGAGVGD